METLFCFFFFIRIRKKDRKEGEKKRLSGSGDQGDDDGAFENRQFELDHTPLSEGGGTDTGSHCSFSSSTRACSRHCRV